MGKKYDCLICNKIIKEEPNYVEFGYILENVKEFENDQEPDVTYFCHKQCRDNLLKLFNA